MSPFWIDTIQILFLLLVTSVLTYLVFSYRKTSTMAREIDDLNLTIKDLRAENSLLKDRNYKLEINSEKFKANLDEANTMIGTLRAENGGLKEQIAEKTNQILLLQEIESKYNNLNSQFGEIQTENNGLRIQLQETKESLHQITKKNSDLSAHYDALEERYNALLNSSNQLRAEVDALELKFAAAKSDNEQLTLMNKSLSLQPGGNGGASVEVGSASDNSSVSADLESLVHALSVQVGDLEMGKVELEQKITLLNTQLADKEDHNIRLKRDLDDCRKKYKATASELAEDEKKLEAIRQKMGLINFERIGIATEKEKDDLKLISGIGPYIERKLNALGIYTFRQIANFTPEDIAKVTEAIEFFPGRIIRDNWVEQAKTLASKNS